MTGGVEAVYCAALATFDRMQAERGVLTPGHYAQSLRVPVCHVWSAPEPGQSHVDWQAGRCAVCFGRERLFRDHCHLTGFLRGLLCHACNGSESRDDTPTWALYRSRPPTVICGDVAPYNKRSRPDRRILAALGPAPSTQTAIARYMRDALCLQL
jgi:hypothetical protein